MSLSLDIDVGNSRLKWRLRMGADVCQQGFLQKDSELLDDLSLPWNELCQVNVASVASPEIVERLRAQVRLREGVAFFVARTDATFGWVKNAYTDPMCLGVDRWLALIAGFSRHGGPCCIVDCGTAVTVDFVARDGHHEGGYIIPGLRLQQDALRIGTHGVRPDQAMGQLAPGKSTTACVLNGILASLAFGVEGILRNQSSARSGYTLVLTGGDAELIGNAMTLDYRLEPDLVLDGLAIVASSQR